MIKVKYLSKSFNGFKVLDNINLEAGKGGLIAITGKSGSGKTTLLNIIGALESSDSGKVFVDGKDLSALTPKETAHLRNATFGFVFQSFHLENTYSVFKNIEIPLLIADMPKLKRKERIAEVLAKVGMSDKSEQLAATLSGGEKQRISIARALANYPKVILADEPTGNLDTANGKAVIDLLKNLSNEGITVLLVTHNPTDAAAADRIVHIEDGKIKC